jgi:hypothetical protein
VTDEVGCKDATQFFGVIAPGRAPDHSHVYDEVIYVLEGEGVFHGGGEDRPVRGLVHPYSALLRPLAREQRRHLDADRRDLPSVRRSRLSGLRGKRMTRKDVSTPSGTESMRRAT